MSLVFDSDFCLPGESVGRNFPVLYNIPSNISQSVGCPTSSNCLLTPTQDVCCLPPKLFATFLFGSKALSSKTKTCLDDFHKLTSFHLSVLLTGESPQACATVVNSHLTQPSPKSFSKSYWRLVYLPDALRESAVGFPFHTLSLSFLLCNICFNVCMWGCFLLPYVSTFLL